MNALRAQRRMRKTWPALEQLDSRITPSAIPAAAALAAELRVETRQLGRWEVALANSHSANRERILANHINRTEARMAQQEARLARINAPMMARIEAGNLARAAAAATAQQNAVTPQGRVSPSSPVPVFPRHPIIVTAPVTLDTTLQAAATSTGSQSTGTTTTGTTTGSSSQPSLPANVAQTLDVIYDAFQQDGSSVPASLPTTDGANRVVIQGTNVGIQVHDGNPANFNTLVSALESAGMQIQTSSAQYGTVVGLLPIAQLPTVAALSDAPSVTPLYHATMN